MQTVNEKTIKQTDVMNSKFIAILLPLTDDNLFKDILKDVKADYKKAKHYCYAYRVGMKSKSNDDGEPSGTAGRPLLDLLHKRNLNDVALIVVRYFGRTKLGAGRLLRTYVQAGVNVINASTLIELEEK